MARRASAAHGSVSSSQFIDSSFHPGFVNLGNTCFLNSVLQAASATQSLKQLYHPDDLLDDSTSGAAIRGRAERVAAAKGAAELSDEAAFAQLVEQLSARSKSPVLQLVDEEKGRLKSYPASRRTSLVEFSAASSLLARSGQSESTVDSTVSSTRSSIDIKGYEPCSTDLPLNTAFRHILEKTWMSDESKVASTSKGKPKASAINPKRLLSLMASKYDQYGDYAQQDGHELLRHLLDSLRMEELDVIKKIRPPLPHNSKKRDRAHSTAIELKKSKEEALQPFVDNLFCGKLLSCVVCEGCRHVSHTYEDFYDISLSIRGDTDAKSAVKRDRMRSMADRWKRATTSKTVGNGPGSRSALDSMTSLRDDLVGSISDTEDAESAKAGGAGIVRPKSAAAGQNPAMMDANNRASAKTFVMKSLQPEVSQSVEIDLEKSSLQGDEKKGGAAALLRAVSTRSRSKNRTGPSSRGPSPIKEEIHHVVDGGKAASQQDHHHHHHHHLRRYDSKAKQSKHSAYLAKLLLEAPQPALAPTNALLWGRRTPAPSITDQSIDAGHRKTTEGADLEVQQANTGLVRALHQFTAVEVLDGANSFACKRCWRLLNPPSEAEKSRLRQRRLRRGRDEDESEKSSDDDPSSAEEDQGQHTEISPQSSTDSKPSRPAATPHVDWAKTLRPHSKEQQAVPSIETTAPPSPTSQVEQAEVSDQTGKSTPSPSRAPLLKAPKAVTASSKGLTLGESLSSASSDEGQSDGVEDEVDGRRATSVTFEDQQSKGGNKKTALPMAVRPVALRSKRSTHSLQRRALKRFLIANTPRVLVFHFKRFQASSRGFSSYSFSSSFKKIDDYVSFPEYLDVKPWLAPPREEYSQSGFLKKSSDVRALTKAQQEEIQEQDKTHNNKWGWKHWHSAKDEREAEQLDADTKTKYRLYGVVVHQGSMNGGHYTAYVLSDRIGEPIKGRVVSETPSLTPTATATPGGNLADNSKKSPYLANSEAAKSISNDNSLRSSLSLNSLKSSNGGPLSANNSNSNSTAALSGSDAMTSVTSASASASASTNSSSGSKPSPYVPSVSKTNEVQNPQTGPSSAAMTPSGSSNGAGTLPRLTEKKQDSRRWIFCSDTVVRGATLEEVLKAQAYMLFYEQV